MRHRIGWLAIAVLTWGCGSDPVPFSPTTTFGSSVRRASSVAAPDGWLPWYWPAWQGGLGEPLVYGTTVNAVVEANVVCVSNLRQVWDARSSCRRYVVEVSSPGQLDVALQWDNAAPGFDLTLAGEVVLVASSGRFASSDWQSLDPHVLAVVEPGRYDLLVISYVQTNQPFQVTANLSPAGTR